MKQFYPKVFWYIFFYGILGGLMGLIAYAVLGTLLSRSAIAGGFHFEISEIPVEFLKWYGLMFLAYTILVFILAKLTYRSFRYELTDTDVYREFRSVFKSKSTVTIPFDRIQNVYIYRGIVARILGLSDVYIQTAGSSAVATRCMRYFFMGFDSKGLLSGLSQEVAEQLRDELIKRARQAKNQVL